MDDISCSSRSKHCFVSNVFFRAAVTVELRLPQPLVSISDTGELFGGEGEFEGSVVGFGDHRGCVCEGR